MPFGNPMGYMGMSGMGGFDPTMLQRLQTGMAGMGQPTPMGQDVQNFLQPGAGTLGQAAAVQPPFQQMQRNLGAAVQPGSFNLGGAVNNFPGNSLGQAALDQARTRGGMSNPGPRRSSY